MKGYLTESEYDESPEDTMSDAEETEAAQGARRPGSQGRANRREARAKRNAEHAPYIQRKIGYFDVLNEEGLCLIER